MIAKRIFDVCLAITGIIILSPLFIIIIVLILLSSGTPVFYVQNRVGRNGIDFGLLKFRTMFQNSDKLGYLTIGEHDRRITRIGYWLRKYKLDELPQLFNVLLGHMSFVGPRPEVDKYVKLYNEQQRRILSVKPGITDYASIKYINENEILAGAKNPEKLYINKIIPSKIRYNLTYIDHHDLWVDIKIIFSTLKKVFHN